MKIFQKGFNYSQDGPGNRLVYHISGCNMKCRWCANPEGMHITSKATEYTAEQITKEAKSCKPFFFGGGGVTFTGGEATLNCNELTEALQMLKNEEIHTALETNGTSPQLFEILKYTDYLMMDFKHFDDDKLKEYTGYAGEQIKENYKQVCKSGRQCHIRIPLVNEFNGGCAAEFAKYLSQYPTENVVFEFLRYHEYGKNKWNGEYKITDGFVTDEIVQSFEIEFENNGLKCIKT